MIAPLSPDAVQAFCDSLPHQYRSAYSAENIAAHARIAAARAGQPVATGRFDDFRDDAAGVCVVADDRPGLLYLISAAIVSCGLDIAAAEAYTREVDGGARQEAVDLFWLRRRQAEGYVPATDEEARQIRIILTKLLEGERDPASIVVPATEAGPANATVRFLDDKGGRLTTLEVETSDRNGLLLSLSRALYEAEVQIVRSDVRTHGDRVVDRFAIVEADGNPIRAARRFELQVAVLGALEPAQRSAAPKPG